MKSIFVPTQIRIIFLFKKEPLKTQSDNKMYLYTHNRDGKTVRRQERAEKKRNTENEPFAAVCISKTVLCGRAYHSM